ncbi:MAG TPA: hypothetical protein VF407_02450 [Polyangiaceae bacterium]
MKSRSIARALTVAVLAVSAVGCGNTDEPYKPLPAFSGSKPSLPSVPSLPTTPIKGSGDSYTVYGAGHQLRSRIHAADVTAKEITIEGYIIDSNIERAPKCAVHKTGKKDPDDCVTEIPTFTISDDKNATVDAKTPKIKVMGWASNFANVFDAMQKYKGLKDPPKELVNDETWAVPIPFPLPAKGAKVKVTGKYGVNFARASSGLSADPINGVMTYSKLEYEEPSTEPAAFATADSTKK